MVVSILFTVINGVISLDLPQLSKLRRQGLFVCLLVKIYFINEVIMTRDYNNIFYFSI